MAKKPPATYYVTSTLAKTDDGTIQITFNIPFSLITKTRQEVLGDLRKDVEVSGFRKGNAPLDKVAEKLAPNTVLEKVLAKILPSALSDAISKYKIRPAIYPKFELVKAKDNEDWEVRGTTCELPEVVLGNYKSALSAGSKSKAIWTPQSSGAKGSQTGEAHEPSREEKEGEVIKTLLSSTTLIVPKILIDEEVNARLSNLLSRLEKLGLSLESYLTSIGKNAQTLRAEYEEQAKNTIALELMLNKIAEEREINVSESQIDEALKVSTPETQDSERFNTPEQRRLIGSILKRRASLDYLVSLV